MMTRSGQPKFPCQSLTWHYARMHGPVYQTFDPLTRLRSAAAREAAGAALPARRTCAAHGVRAGCFGPPPVPAGAACLRLTGRATLTEIDIRVASRVLAIMRDYCRNTAQAGRNTR
jgi:7-keto-8-aminopelargonate synthetase-like enzyme